MDGHVIAHAAVVTALTFGVLPWSIWAAVHRKRAHVAWMPAIGAGIGAVFVHAFWWVDAVGPHSEAHGILGTALAFFLCVQFAAAVARARPAVRSAHVWIGRALVVVAFPAQWWLGLGVWCNDTSTAFTGHWSVAVFTQLYAILALSRGTIDLDTEARILGAGGAVGLVGDFLITVDGFTARRLQHLYLYITFVVAATIELATRSAVPATVALGSMGILMLVHQHGGDHAAHLGHHEMEMDKGGTGLTMAMHATSGALLLAAAVLRGTRRFRPMGVAMLAFSVTFSASQPEICQCLGSAGLPPAVYYTVALQLAATVAAATVAVLPRPGPVYTKTRLVLASSSESDDDSERPSISGIDGEP